MANIATYREKEKTNAEKDSRCTPLDILQTTDTYQKFACQILLRKSYAIEEFADDKEQKAFDKKVGKWCRRKITAQEIASQCAQYELTLPKSDRNKKNAKISYEYKARRSENGNFLVNRYNDVLYKRTNIEREENESYNHFTNVGNQRRWAKMYHCRQEYHPKKDKVTGKVVYRPTSQCQNKLCPNCNQLKTITALNKYLPRVKHLLHDPVMVVLHAKSPGLGKLKDHIDAMTLTLRSIFKVRNKNPHKENFSGVLSLEVTSNPVAKTYHPHFHICIERHLAEELVNLWLIHELKTKEEGGYKLYKTAKAHTNEKTGELYSEISKHENGTLNLNEFFKYVMKISVSTKNKKVSDDGRKEMSSAQMIYEIDMALNNKKTYRAFGLCAEGDKSKESSVIVEYVEEVAIPPTHGFVALGDSWKWMGYDYEATNIPGMMLAGFIPTIENMKFVGYGRKRIRQLQQKVHDIDTIDFASLEKLEIEWKGTDLVI